MLVVLPPLPQDFRAIASWPRSALESIEMSRYVGVPMVLLRHLFHRAWPWMLGSVLAGCILVGTLGNLLPGRLPPMQLLRLEAPPTLVLAPQQAPTFTVQITNVSSERVTTCGIVGLLDQSSGLSRIEQVISVSSAHFDLPAGTHTTVVLSLPRDAIPLPKTHHEIALSVSCTEPTHLETRPHITVVMSDA